MISHLLRLVRPALFLGSLALAGASTSAQTAIGGTIFDGSGGPLLSGQVYHATTSLTVPAGQTLTIQPGAIIKFATAGSRVTVSGTLDAQGTLANKIRFTGIMDDSAGGDTNGDGPSSASPGSWQGLVLNGGSVVTLAHVDLAYFGSSLWAGITDSSASLSISESVLRDGLAEAIEFNGTANSVSVTDTAFLDNGGIAVDGAPIAVCEGFLDNEATGNGGNYIKVTAPSTAAVVSVGPENALNDVLVFSTSSTISSGGSLTIRAGLTVKMLTSGSRITANGTFRLAGAPSNPAVITSFADDDHAGDTNNDGVSSGAPGGWQTVLVNGTGTFEATDAIVRYAGSGLWGAVQGVGALNLLRTTVRDSLDEGINLSSSTLVPSIRNCDLINNGGGAITEARIDAAAGFKRNRASGNGGGNYVLFSVPSPSADVHVKRHNLIGDLMVMQTSSTISAGVKLTLDAGVIVKWLTAGSRMTVNGSLELLGQPCEPTVFTAFSDDSRGGDTNLDGPSAGTPGAWQTIIVNASGSLRAVYAEVLWAGSSGWPGIYSNSTSLELRDCLIQNSLVDGMDLTNLASAPTVVRCRFENNGARAVDNAHIEAVPGFLDCTASGNGNGDHLYVTTPSPVGDVTIGPENTLGAPLVLANSLTISSGQTLTLKSGTAIKWAIAGRLTVNGTLRTRGSGMRPVVLTSFVDDAIGGDTNGDGPSAGVPGGWQVILVNASGTADLEHTLLRFPGSSAWSGILISSTSPNPATSTLSSVRVEHALAHGMRLSGLASDPENLVAFDCGGTGIDLTAGNYDLRHVTAVGNGNDGIKAAVAYTGSVVNSVAWGNVPANYNGFGAGDLLSSNGSATHAGSNGNLNVAPAFVDSSATVGDLRLLPGSALVDVADSAVAQAVVTDFDENSRLLDPNLTGILRADMGAYERARWEMKVFGEPRAGTDLRCRVDGPAGVSTYWLGLLDGTSLVAPFGFATAGSTLIPLGTRPVGQILRLHVPDEPSLMGLDFGIQTLTTPVADPTVGALTNLYRAQILEPRTRQLFKPLR